VPVCVAKNRFDAAQALLAAHPDTTIIVCDDGLQHLALHADVSIVVFDERHVGNGWLLPAGLMRERWPHGTGRAVDMVLLALPPDTTAPVHLAVPRTCSPPFLARKTLAGTAYNCVGERRPLETFIPKQTIALAGIAKPELFFEMLRSAGIQPELTIAMADHQKMDEKIYSNLSIEIMRREVLMTEKDGVKFCSNQRLSCQENLTGQIDTPGLSNAPQAHFWAVPLTLEIENSFFTALDAKLSSRHGLQTP
jgi:tetraacyldisaccharide 4'-kinase